jgi:DNA-binding NarL/FixJ family response regulator
VLPLTFSGTNLTSYILFNIKRYGYDGIVARLDDGDARDLKQLTKRQVQLVQMLSIGFSIREAARELKISHRTAEVHLQRARERLGARTTPQLIGRCFSLGILN